LLAFLFVILAALTYFFLPDSCPEAARRTAFVFVIAAGFWACEILPLYGTSLLVVLLLIFTLAKPGGVMGFDRTGYTVFLVPFSSPIIMLFFGEFVLAKAMAKYQLDELITEKILNRLGGKPKPVLLGMMLTTAFLSMWISNTAATAIVLGVTLPLIAQLDEEEPFREGLILSIPFAANIGGIATPIGTPPNAIALGNLAERGIHLDFFHWMLMAVPLMLVLLAVAYVFLLLLFPLSRQKSHVFALPKAPEVRGEARWILTLFFAVILMWMTTPLHEIPEALTALLAAGVLVMAGWVSREDIKHLDWDVLVLMWGGLALGKAMEITGLAHWVLGLPLFGLDGVSLVMLFAVLAFLLSLFMSNTATASLLVPLAMGLEGESPVIMAVVLALSCSFAMVFPISTPPNALAFSRSGVHSQDMIRAGIIVSVLCLLTLLAGYHWVVPWVFGHLIPAAL
jgi:sodium-dependent dicarboxylate transporter 2/3/5